MTARKRAPLLGRFPIRRTLAAAGAIAATGLASPSDSIAVTPGTLDPSFGSGGLFLDQLAPASSSVGSVVNGVALQSDGKLVLSGSVGDAAGDREAVVARLNPNGTLDTSFDASGAYGGVPGVLIFQADTSPTTGPPESTAGQVAIQHDGKIVVTGTIGSVAIGALPMEGFVARFNPDGTFDPSFGSSGVFSQQFGQAASSSSSLGGVAVQPDGRILVAGVATDLSGHTAALVARLTSSGTLDSTFGASGEFILQAGTCAANTYTTGGLLALEPDGTILSGGRSSTGSGNCGGEALIDVFKLTPAGAIDPNFGSGGLVTEQIGAGASPSSGADRITRAPDGSLVVASTASDAAGRPYFAVIHLSAAGGFDQGFGSAGVAFSQFGQGGSPYSIAQADAVRADGSIDVSGIATVAGTGTGTQALLAQLTPTGRFDPSFGVGGSELAQFGQGSAPSSSLGTMLIEPDGKIVAVGNATDAAGNPQLLVARWLGSGPPSVSITTPASGAAYEPGQSVTASYSCTAAPGAIIASCTGPVASGAAVSAAAAGTHTFTVTGADSYGQTSSAATTYTVLPLVLSRVRQSHRRWRERSRPHRGRTPVGTTFRFALSAAARVSLKFTRGPRSYGTIELNGRAGPNRLTFVGRVPAHKRLKPGAYRVTFTADAGGVISDSVTLKFTVTR